MKFLRGQPDWKKRIEALVPEDVRLGADKLVGTLEVMTPRDPESYILCPGGKLIYDSYIADDGSCCSATHTGTWSVASGDLVVNWTKSCSGVSSGEKVHSAGGCDEFEVCSEKICGPYADVEFAEMILVQREELAAMQTRKTRELFDDGEARVTAFKGAPPFECK